jgi:hypothetical protein
MADIVAGCAGPGRAQERRALRIGGVVAAGPARDGVILGREGEIGPPHRALLLVELLQRMRRVQVVHHVAVDIDEVAAVDAAGHEMGLPDLVEQSSGHVSPAAFSCRWRHVATRKTSPRMRGEVDARA